MFTVTQSMTLLRRTLAGTDERGNDAYTSTSVSFDGVFAPALGAEQASNGENTVTSKPTVFAAADQFADDARPSAADQIQIGPEVWQIDGDPMLWSSPFSTWEPGWQIQLSKVAS